MDRVSSLYYEFDKHGCLVIPDGQNVSTDHFINEDDENDMTVLYQTTQRSQQISLRKLTLVKK